MTPTMNQTVFGLIERPFNHLETIQVLRSQPIKYMCWGVSNTEILTKDGDRYGVLLTVNGMKHKGKVLVTLAGNDTYSVHIINNRGRVLKTYTDVYFDNLVDVIDEHIEKVPQYSF